MKTRSDWLDEVVELAMEELHREHHRLRRGSSMFAQATYPPPAPTYNGDFRTISRFLNDPAAVARRIRTLANQRFVGDRILTGRSGVSGGAIEVEQEDGLFAVGEPESRQPGQEYPISDTGEGVPEVYSVKDWGHATYVTRESILRRRIQPVNRALSKLTNSVVRKVDQAALAAVDASPHLQQIGADWSIASNNKLAMIENARRAINDTDDGFMADTLLVDGTRASELLLDDTIRPAITSTNVVESGQMGNLLGLTILVSPNLPTLGSAWVIDSTALGGMADEEPLQADSEYERKRKRWWIMAERVTTPYVVEPAAAVEITGV